MHILIEMPCTSDGTLAWMFFDAFWVFNAKLHCRIRTRTTLELCSQANNVGDIFTFAKRDMQLASFGTSVHEHIVPIERACFLSLWGRCIMVWFCQWCVFISWMWERSARSEYCASFVCWPSWFCAFAFADHVGFLRLAPVLCTYQRKTGAKRW